jgi:hypothetical protein
MIASPAQGDGCAQGRESATGALLLALLGFITAQRRRQAAR